MKKSIILFVLLAGISLAQAQVRFGLKAGANFSNLDGVSFETKTKTGFHFGAVLELKLPSNFALQPEVVYSSQGADVNYANVHHINYDYITVPVLLKYYVISDLLSIDAGPQFSFLVNDNGSGKFTNFDPGNSSTFDFAVVGGLGVNITKHFFVQGRYVIGLTNTSTDAKFTNKVIQLSVGYMF